MFTMDRLHQLKNSVHLIEVDGVSYVYATHANRLFQLNNDESIILKKLLNDVLQSEECSALNIDSQLVFLHDLYNTSVIEIDSSSTPKLNSLVLLISEACNFACTYCYGAYGAKYKKMSFDTAVHAIDLSLKLGIRDIVFFGGEPLTNFPVIKQAVEYIEQSGYDSIELRMTTNASLVTEEIAAFLHEHNFQVSVSMDGDETSHNTTRLYHSGKPTYLDVLNGINLLKKYGVLTLLEVTYSKRHSDLKKQLESALEIFPIVSCACVDGKKGCKHSEDVITGNRFEEFYITLLDMEDQLNEGESIIGAHELYEKICNGEPLVLPKCLCSDIGTRLIVDPDGQVVPCPEMTDKPEYTICNVNSISSVKDFMYMRNKVLDRLSSDLLEKKWYTPLCETCIQHVNQIDGRFVYQDEDSFESCINSLLTRFIKEHYE